jgi:hypothetical protein
MECHNSSSGAITEVSVLYSSTSVDNFSNTI